jgi:hypothetical protein
MSGLTAKRSSFLGDFGFELRVFFYGDLIACGLFYLRHSDVDAELIPDGLQLAGQYSLLLLGFPAPCLSRFKMCRHIPSLTHPTTANATSF